MVTRPMGDQHDILNETQSTQLAYVRLLPGVRFLMPLEVHLVTEATTAVVARVRTLAGVCAHMCLEIHCRCTLLAT